MFLCDKNIWGEFKGKDSEVSFPMIGSLLLQGRFAAEFDLLAFVDINDHDIDAVAVFHMVVEVVDTRMIEF